MNILAYEISPIIYFLCLVLFSIIIGTVSGHWIILKDRLPKIIGIIILTLGIISSSYILSKLPYSHQDTFSSLVRTIFSSILIVCVYPLLWTISRYIQVNRYYQ